MAKRTAWLYIGLPGTGGPDVTEAAAAHAHTLRERGVGLPAASPEQMRRAAAEILRDHDEQGYRRRDVEGAWAEVCRRAWRGSAASLLGHERLGAADADQVALLLDGLAGMRTRAVVALRDPASLLAEGWAAEVRRGRTPTFARYAERVLDPDAEHAQGARFWAAHDVPGLLDRWTGALGPGQVHAVVLPRGGDPAPALWGRLLELLRLDDDPEALAGPAPRRAAAEHGRGARGDRGDEGPPLPRGAPRPGRRASRRLARPGPAAGAARRPGRRGGGPGREVAGPRRGVGRPGARRPRRPAHRPARDPEPDADAAAAPEALTLAAGALAEASAEVARLRARVVDLERRNARLERKRSTLKGRLAALDR